MWKSALICSLTANEIAQKLLFYGAETVILLILLRNYGCRQESHSIWQLLARSQKELSELVDKGLMIFDIQKIRDFICWKKS